MRILFICKDNPYGIGGGNFATHAYLRAFSDMCAGNIDVFMAAHIKEDDSIKVAHFYRVPERSIADKLLSVFTGYRHRNVKPVLRHLEKDHDYDYCVFNNSNVSSGIIERTESYGIKAITIHHNYEVEFFRDNMPLAARLLYLHHVRKTERNAYIRSHYNLFLTQQDIETFRREYGDDNGTANLLGTFEYKDIKENIEHQNIKSNNQDNKLKIAITGSLCTVQGVDGIKYFFKELYDYLPSSYEVTISGRSPEPEVVRLCESKANVHLVANPDNISDVIRQSDIYLCPTRLGGGLKLRVMDGLRLGIPVVTHSCSARGYDVFRDSGFFYEFSSPKEFGHAIEILQEAYSRGEVDRQRIRNEYLRVFSYEAGFQRLKQIVKT